MSVHFWPHTNETSVASFRLRCLAVIDGLRLRGVDACLFKEGDVPQNLVLSKRYDLESVQKALELKARFGTKLYLDICDNHFYYDHADEHVAAKAEQLRQAILSVDVIIASSQYLADIVRSEAGAAAKVSVIGDLVEFPAKVSLRQCLFHPILYWQYRWLRCMLSRLRREKSTALVWFGNHGSPRVSGGMGDLKSIKHFLEEMHGRTPISLTIVSNSRERFDMLTGGWQFPTFYMPWSVAFFSEILRLHKVAVIPIQANPFTLSKSPNRVLTSLVHGLTVLADAIPSYMEFQPPVFLNKWDADLNILLRDAAVDKNSYDAEFFQMNNANICELWERTVLNG